MNMHERIEKGKLFTDYCEGLPEKRLQCKKTMMEFNSSDPEDIQNRIRLVEKLLEKKAQVWIEPPFYCCYGSNITLGEQTYVNMNCCFIDDGKINVGKKVLFDPCVTIATVAHPIKPDKRKYMVADPVTIHDNC